MTLYPDNSQFVEASGLKDLSVTPAAYINNATLTATLYDSNDAAVAGAVSMVGQYQAGSNGNYRFFVDPVAFHPEPGSYSLIIDGTRSGARYHTTLAVTVKTRNKGTEA